MKTAAGTALLALAMVAQAQPATFDLSAYLADGPTPWQPAEIDVRHWRPDFVVAADGSGTHRRVQDAVDAVPAAGDGARRWYIHVKPGVYRGPLCARGKPPLAIYGTPGDAGAATLVDSRYNGLPKRAGIDAAQPCHPHLAAATHGTSGSATAIIDSPDVLLAHLTLANDATEGAGASIADGAQAVALLTRADRIQLEDLRLRSHQDTFYVRRPSPEQPARVFVRGSWIAGDVDFVFGNATLVIDDSTLISRSGRRPAGHGGFVFAPSTPAAAARGFLVQRSRFVAEPGLAPGGTALARAWDEGVAPRQWQPGASPNGQLLVRNSALGPHIGGWGASTARREATDSGPQAHRFSQQHNRSLPADIAREVPLPHEGWAAAEGGTRGGADAVPADVHRVHDRASLAAALRPHERPRIVQVSGRIDLSVDDQGRPLGAEDFRDPSFSWPAFAAAYDPATWGRRAPEGPLEEARQRSARAQAARVVLRVPSRTTLIGMGSGAQIVNGGLMLERVHDVIVRNIHFSGAYDHFPAWDPKDNADGEWNSEYDTLSLRGATRVWIDHCRFDDGERSDNAEPRIFGRPLQRHDGLLDITRASDLVTVSWNHFEGHDKTTLVGGGDRHLEDEGRLRVSFHHNRYERTRERTPRVRFGRVHVFNNLFLAPEAAAFAYSIGVGLRSAIISEHNAWLAAPEIDAAHLVRPLGGSAFVDRGSWLNGRPVDLQGALRTLPRGAGIDDRVGWAPDAAVRVDPVAEVAPRVRAGAGAGRLWTGWPR